MEDAFHLRDMLQPTAALLLELNVFMNLSKISLLNGGPIKLFFKFINQS